MGFESEYQIQHVFVLLENTLNTIINIFVAVFGKEYNETLPLIQCVQSSDLCCNSNISTQREYDLYMAVIICIYL